MYVSCLHGPTGQCFAGEAYVSVLVSCRGDAAGLDIKIDTSSDYSSSVLETLGYTR